jgi:hypothetical protein
MMCFKAKTFCPFYVLCLNGYSCNKALTDQVKQDAVKWWGKDGAPISVYSSFPECFVRFFETKEKE